MSALCPVRPTGVLDACVLIPPGLRDVLLSCAEQSAFRPVWQDEILDEVRRNSVRLLKDRSGLTDDAAIAAAAHLLERMSHAFPNARQPGDVWIPLVPVLTCDEKDRHVLAVAIGAAATHGCNGDHVTPLSAAEEDCPRTGGGDGEGQVHPRLRR
jgi:predicted nucleic acid-binding protein